MEREFVIIGAGVAGLTLANQLAERNIPSTVIGAPPAPAEDTAHRTSTPIISTRLARRLDITVIPEQHIDSMHPGIKTNPARKALSLLAGIALRERSFVTLDTEAVKRELWEKARTSPLIELIEGKAVDVTTQKSRVTGIQTDSGDTITAPLLIDATGRPARVAGKVEEKMPHSIVETGFAQPSGIIGCYVSFKEGVEPALHRNHDMVIGRLPKNGVLGILARHMTTGSPATHLLLFEGEKSVVQAAMRAALQEPGSPNDKQCCALHILTEGTPWQSLVTSIATLDRPVYFHHNKTLARTVYAQGLSLLGDAQLMVNPIQGAGYRHILEDTNCLVDLITRYPDHAGDLYNQLQYHISARRLEKAQKRSNRFTKAQDIFTRFSRS